MLLFGIKCKSVTLISKPSLLMRCYSPLDKFLFNEIRRFTDFVACFVLSYPGKWCKIFIFLGEACWGYHVEDLKLVTLWTASRCLTDFLLYKKHIVCLNCCFRDEFARVYLRFTSFTIVRKEESTCSLCWVEMVHMLVQMQFMMRYLCLASIVI